MRKGRSKAFSLDKITSMALVASLLVFGTAVAVRNLSSPDLGYGQQTTTASASASSAASASAASSSSSSSTASAGGTSATSKSATVAGTSAASAAAEGSVVPSDSGGNSSVVIIVDDTAVPYKLTYQWEGAPGVDVALYDAAGSRVFLELPPEATLVKDAAFSVNTTYAKGLTYFVKNAADKVCGSYVFGGWDLEGDQTMGAADLVISGTWIYERIALPAHQVTYAWTGLPADAQLYDVQGNPATPTLPAAAAVEEDATFTVDQSLTAGVTYYVRDQQGRALESYAFSGWNLQGEQTMGAADLVISGTWTYTQIAKPLHQVTYSWSGLPADVQLFDAQGNPATPALPAAAAVEEDASFTPDQSLAVGATLYIHDAQGAITGGYTFSGWMAPGQQTPLTEPLVMGTSDLSLQATWTYADISKPQHRVSYSWTGLPAGLQQLYDAQGNPVTVSLPEALQVEEGAEFAVDQAYSAGMTLYIRNNDGLAVRQYTFSGWSIQGSQTMETSDVAITGVWQSGLITYEISFAWQWLECAAPTASVFYEVDMNDPYDYDDEGAMTPKVLREVSASDLLALPETQRRAPSTSVAIESAPASDKLYFVKDESGAFTGAYAFAGWYALGTYFFVGDSIDVTDEDIQVAGQWVFEPFEAGE